LTATGRGAAPGGRRLGLEETTREGGREDSSRRWVEEEV